MFHDFHGYFCSSSNLPLPLSVTSFPLVARPPKFKSTGFHWLAKLFVPSVAFTNFLPHQFHDLHHRTFVHRSDRSLRRFRFPRKLLFQKPILVARFHFPRSSSSLAYDDHSHSLFERKQAGNTLQTKSHYWKDNCRHNKWWESAWRKPTFSSTEGTL